MLEQAALGGARLRDAVIEASLAIEAALAEEPFAAGESREPGTRVLIATPLAVTFHVHEIHK